MFDDRLRLGEATLMVKPSCKTLTGRLEFSDPSVNFVFRSEKRRGRLLRWIFFAGSVPLLAHPSCSVGSEPGTASGFVVYALI